MKKVHFLLAAILFGGILINAQNNLKVNISNIKSPNGLIEIGLFNSEKGFLKEGGQFLKKKVKVIGNSAQYTFNNLPKAEYSLAIFHDKNQNNKCDTNFLGIPTEGYGFSNNFKPTISAPKFSQTKFNLEKDKMVSIRLIN